MFANTRIRIIKSSFFKSGGNADVGSAFLNVMYHNGTCADKAPAADIDVVAHNGACAYPRQLTDVYRSAQVRADGNVNKILNRAVVKSRC